MTCALCRAGFISQAVVSVVRRGRSREMLKCSSLCADMCVDLFLFHSLGFVLRQIAFKIKQLYIYVKIYFSTSTVLTVYTDGK